MMIRKQRKGTPLLQTEHQKRSAFEKCPMYCFRAHSVRPAELRLRNTGVVTEQVSQKTVALIGLGALGSEVAELLAKGRGRSLPGSETPTVWPPEMSCGMSAA